MNRSASIVLAGALALAAPLAAQAASSASSLASESLTASSGSISDSLEGSSESSSRPVRRAEGDYRVTRVAAAADRAGYARLTLAPAAGQHEGFVLVLPAATADAAGLAAGQVVRAQPQPYGIRFARADRTEPFFLALDDAWQRELAAHPVTL
ncbi:MAG: hypothetical protein HY856_12280 [Burkholderiales bacterium]|nr:hypothetical protein [Burkholderiales bacterium]